MKIREQPRCRAGGGLLQEVLDLGELPLSCFPLPSDPPLERHPLRLGISAQSGLLQLCHSVDPDTMYQHYWYLSGINGSMRQALASIVAEGLRRSYQPLQKDDIVVDIACNDGTLLSAYPSELCRVGIDPAQNITPQHCDVHINTYFSAGSYRARMGSAQAKLITSIAMFYDLEDPVAFSRDVAEILDPQGLWIIELSYLPTMLQNNAFETICAEHLEYYSLGSIETILHQANLSIEDVELNRVNGGSFRVYVRHASCCTPTRALNAMRTLEKQMHLTDPATYTAFQERILKNKEEMLSFLQEQKRLGKKVIGYGASTKGNTLLSYYGIDTDLLSCIADRNPMKWGRQTVTRIPIISEEEARLLEPDYFLALPYHFMDEFLQREEAFIQKGGIFVAPIPQLTFFGSSR